MGDYNQWHDELPPSPLYDPNSKVINYKFDEDYRNLQLTFVRSGLLYEDNRTHYQLYQIDNQYLEWRRPKEICSYPKFHDGKLSRFDALQGALGDCWLMAAIEGLTFHDELMNFVVPRNQGFELPWYIGAFHFRIWRLGTWYDVIVDDRLPVYKHNGKLCFGHSERGDIFWAALLEKAYMKMCAADFVKPEYDSLDFGLPIISMQELTGGIVEYTRMAKVKINKAYLIWWFNQLFNSQAIMCCSRSTEKGPDLGIYAAHSYAITKVYKCSDDDSDYAGLFLLRVLNPWGHAEWKGDWSDDDYNYWRQIDHSLRDKLEYVKRDDGEFFMDENGFMSIFDKVFICHMGPGQYLAAHSGKPAFKSWKTTFCRGEWAHWISDAGSDVYDRFQNPQYRFELHRDNDDANQDGKCTVVIELTHRCKQHGRNRDLFIAYYVYFVPNPLNYPKRLDRQFFQTFQPLNGDPDFESSEGKAYTSSIDLDPDGVYCVVPCTQFARDESQFLLRVFSESSVHLYDQDDRISKALPVNEHVESCKTTNELLQKLFNYGAQGQGEIDWLQLKMVLEMSMNPTFSSFGLIYSILKFIRITIKKIWSSKDGDNGEGFTKDECRRMISMMDLNHTGKLNFSEFSNLWMKINFWNKVYEQHVGEKEQLLPVSQLREALTSIGYEINRRTIHSLSYIYANDEGQICLSDFIMCGVAVETVVSRHLKEGEKCGNKFTFTLEEWVKNTLSL